ncbi:MAG TPA: hypothetical protein VHB21_24375, partial [Minicystis sp.]|nr:hypothetical protein [Minicystis sp.]
MTHAYPADLARSALERWRELHVELDLPAPIDDDALVELVSTVYHATLLREEERPVTFRLLLVDPSRLPEHGGPPDGLHRLAFTRARPFDAHELRRLSPAAKYHRAL